MRFLASVRRGVPVLLCASALCLAPAFAQDGDDGDTPTDRKVLVAKAYEAARKKNWREVSDAITELTNISGGKADSRLLFLKAKAFFEQARPSLGKKGKKAAEGKEALDASKDALKVLLEQHPDHVEGTYLYAVIEASSDNETEAKGRLIRAAARGRYVLYDLESSEGKKTFKGYLKDPEFILDVMNAASEFQVNLKSLRNPFASPIRRIVESDDGDDDGLPKVSVLIPKRLQQLEAQVDKLFAKIDELAKRQDAEAMSIKFQELRALMNEYGAEGSDMAKEKLATWKQKLIQYGDLYLSIQLQIYIQEGNQHLKAMAKALEQEEWDLALQRFEDIKELRDQMMAEERDVFRRNAKALLVRGKSLAEQAIRMKRISEFKLRITGIILAPPEDERQKDSAIVDDRIYYEHDHLIDVETEEEIPDLEVVEILKSRVRFRYQGTEFVRGLERPNENKASEEAGK
ncbi:MAG: hypothetical protein JKY65_01560 [Planctomycetes bacterium]|nr:hypothetical protein [Planctomycetota bacterium]